MNGNILICFGGESVTQPFLSSLIQAITMLSHQLKAWTAATFALVIFVGKLLNQKKSLQVGCSFNLILPIVVNVIQARMVSGHYILQRSLNN